ncbi:MAG: hypothetical protein Q8R15_03850 [Candidatus Micrarchaeota archaeon]|nr:hypothetical protein [Candidatus Micrarchaeota archaeon]
MSTKRPYTVVEIGPGYSFEPSPVLVNHVNKLPHEKIAYFALDPLYATPVGNSSLAARAKKKFLQIGARISRKPFGVEAVRKAARSGVRVDYVKYCAPQVLPFRNGAVDEMHVHSLLNSIQYGGINHNPEDFLQRAGAVLKADGRLFFSGSPGNSFFELTRQTDHWFEQRGFTVDKRAGEAEAASFSRFSPDKLIILRKK